MAMESPFVTAFLLLLKWANFPVPEGFTNLFLLFSHIAKALYIGGYAQDLLMDRNPKIILTRGPQKYDFIIVGGGPAGCILAMRLCDKYKVLLLEAGAEPTFLSQIPLFNAFQWTSNSTNWGFYSSAQENSSLSARKRKVKLIQGKALGGSMTLGHSVYSRGNPKDFDVWANETGDDSWNYKNLIKYFKKTENYKGKFDDSVNHGFSGPLKVTNQGYQPLAKEWVAGAVELRLNSTDPNEFQSQTFSPVEVTILEGKKQNAYDQILRKDRWRKNLKITKYAYVQKIIFDKNTAKGVIYRRGIRHIKALATKEVILSAGVYNTPKLLMLSGIGPSSHLRSKDIKIKKDLPHVGQHLQDQPATVFGPVTVTNEKSFLPKKNLTYSVLLEYHANQSGPGASNLFGGLGYYTTPKTPDPNWPNIQLVMIPIGVDEDTYGVLNDAFHLKDDYFEKYMKSTKSSDAVWVVVSLGRPMSRGYVELENKKWDTHPNINPNYFTDPSDIQSVVDGMKLVSKLFQTEEWSAVDAQLITTAFPGCERFKVKTDQYYACFARHFTISIGNTGGTCRMGKTPEDSVVDNKLLVHKMKHLRIVDASVMPIITNAFQGAAVIAIAEKAADMIFYKWDEAVNRHRDRNDDSKED